MIFNDSEMNSNDIGNLLQQILSKLDKNSSTPLLILQGITLGLLILKPIAMYYIQAKYNAPPPHDSILRTVNDNIDETKTYQCKDGSEV